MGIPHYVLSATRIDHHTNIGARILAKSRSHILVSRSNWILVCIEFCKNNHLCINIRTIIGLCSSKVIGPLNYASLPNVLRPKVDVKT